MLVGIDFRLDVLEDLLLVGAVFGQQLEVLALLDLYHLVKLVANLPILLRYPAVFIKGLHSAPFLLEKQVHFANAIDRVTLLPHELQARLFLQACC